MLFAVWQSAYVLKTGSENSWKQRKPVYKGKTQLKIQPTQMQPESKTPPTRYSPPSRTVFERKLKAGQKKRQARMGSETVQTGKSQKQTRQKANTAKLKKDATRQTQTKRQKKYRAEKRRFRPMCRKKMPPPKEKAPTYACLDLKQKNEYWPYDTSACLCSMHMQADLLYSSPNRNDQQYGLR